MPDRGSSKMLKYDLKKNEFIDDEQAGLEAFYRYAAEAGVIEVAGPVRFY